MSAEMDGLSICSTGLGEFFIKGISAVPQMPSTMD
jgi:hypothetical protein